MESKKKSNLGSGSQKIQKTRGCCARLGMTDTIKFRIQSDRVEANLCSDLWILFLCHRSWRKNLVTVAECIGKFN